MSNDFLPTGERGGAGRGATFNEPSMTSAASGERGRLWPLFAVMFLSTFALNDSNVALPSLKADLALDAGEASLVLTTLNSSFAGTVLIGGRLGDRYGRRRLFAVGAALAAVAGVVAALAPSFPVLLGARVVQGASLGIALPQVLATIQAARHGEPRRRALAIYAAVGGAGTATGLVLGGVAVSLAGEHGWRAALGVLAAIAVVALLGAPLVPRTRGHGRRRPPVLSSLLVLAALVLFTSSLALGAGRGWWPGPTMGALGATVLAVLFWVVERRRERRGGAVLVPGAVAREPVLGRGLALAVFFFAPFAGFATTIAVLTQGRLGLAAWSSGLGMLGLAACFVAGSVLLAAAQARWGTRMLERATALQLLALLGLLLGGALSLWSGAASWVWWVQVPMLLLGVAQSWQYGPVLAIVVAHVPDDIAGLSGGLFSTVQQVALALGVLLMGSVYAAASAGVDGPIAFGITTVIQMLGSMVFLLVAGALRRRVARGEPAT